jgi:hypothetical protein
VSAWHDRPVRLRTILVLIAAVAGAVYVAGLAVAAPLPTRVAGAVVFAALAGYAAFAPRVRVRVPLVVGLLLPALAYTGAALVAGSSSGVRLYGWFSYQPLAEHHVNVAVQATRDGFGGMAVPLLAYLALALAVAALPRRRRPVLLVAGLLALAALAGWIAVQLRTGTLDGPVPVADALALIGAPLLLAVLTLGAAVLATQRVHGILVAAGLALSAVPALFLLDLSQYTIAVYTVGQLPALTGVEQSLYWFGGNGFIGIYSMPSVRTALLGAAQVVGAILVTLGGAQHVRSAAAEDGDIG